MHLTAITTIPSPNGGPERKYYALTPDGKQVLRRFIALHITPLHTSPIKELIAHIEKGESS